MTDGFWMMIDILVIDVLKGNHPSLCFLVWFRSLGTKDSLLQPRMWDAMGQSGCFEVKEEGEDEQRWSSRMAIRLVASNIVDTLW